MVENAQEHRDDPLALRSVELSSLLFNLGLSNEAYLLLISYQSHFENFSFQILYLDFI